MSSDSTSRDLGRTQGRRRVANDPKHSSEQATPADGNESGKKRHARGRFSAAFGPAHRGVGHDGASDS